MKLKKEKFGGQDCHLSFSGDFFALLNKQHVRGTSIKERKDYSGQISENSPKAHLGLCERNEHRTRISLFYQNACNRLSCDFRMFCIHGSSSSAK